MLCTTEDDNGSDNTDGIVSMTIAKKGPATFADNRVEGDSILHTMGNEPTQTTNESQTKIVFAISSQQTAATSGGQGSHKRGQSNPVPGSKI